MNARACLAALFICVAACGDDDPCEGAGCPCIDCPDHCVSMETDGDETDVDCGGSCNGCAAGQACIDDDDCVGSCSPTLAVCVSGDCGNGVVDGDETDVDCGGSCGGCAPGLACSEGSDCEFGVCGVLSTCLPFECVDGEMNGTESDIDCGGDICDPCPSERMCNGPDDCLDLICTDGTCAFPECNDGIQNGVETGTDCGGFCPPCHCTSGTLDGDERDVDCGGSCDACDIGQMCDTFEDCLSGICSRAGVCLFATCGNAMMDGDETDVDCGGSCDPCGADGRCLINEDCDSGSCDGGICAAPRCDDGLRNGDEEDVDCGGSCPFACTCFDGSTSGDETDLDCGGGCTPCADGRACEFATDCTSALCNGDICRPTTCIDGSLTTMETDVDCGGPCPPCADGESCGDPVDCVSGICIGMVCATASCSDGVRNGFEGDIDCGGGCPPCADGSSCVTDTDCSSRRCTAMSCVAPACGDGLFNGDETGVDCGGSCPACFPAHCGNGSMDGDELATDCGGSCLGCSTGTTCSDGAECASGRCTGSTCAAPSCSDGAQADGESDIDCGGTCPDCDPGDDCRIDSDCSSGRCDGTCLLGPAASFTTTRDGAAPLPLDVFSHARVGDNPIVDVRYDFDEGGGFQADSTHVYSASGLYTITQLIRDSAGIESTASKRVRVRPFDARLNRSTLVTPMRLERDDLTYMADSGFALGAARSDVAIAPGSGIFYVEARWLSDTNGDWGFGVGTSAFTLGDSLGSNDDALGVGASGSVFYNGMFQGGSRPPGQEAVGLVVDYRGVNPIVHVIQSDTELPFSVMLTGITTDLYVIASGARSDIGPLLALNTGFDTRNFPHVYDVAARLSAASIAAPGLQLGWGGTGIFPANAPPVLSASATATTPFGTPVLLSASAIDAVDGDLSHSLRWDNTSDTFNDRPIAYGADFLFDPPSLGVHHVRAWTVDAEGEIGEVTIAVTVTGALTRFDPVVLVNEPTTGDGIIVSTEGLRARFTTSQKSGMRANQAIIDGFHYFEANRMGAITAQGVGIITPFGDLDPYSEEIVPWSCSAQVLDGLWRNFIRVSGWDNTQTDIGVAVDYRGDYPVVYFITNDMVELELHMTEITVPVHPLIYGQPPGFSGWQWGMNFGTAPFANDAVAALTTHGVADAGMLTLSWGR